MDGTGSAGSLVFEAEEKNLLGGNERHSRDITETSVGTKNMALLGLDYKWKSLFLICETPLFPFVPNSPLFPSRLKHVKRRAQGAANMALGKGDLAAVPL